MSIKNWMDLIIESINKKINKTEIPYFDRYYGCSGTGDAVILSSPGEVVETYVVGLKITFIAAAANTGAVTVDVDGLGPLPLKKSPAEEFSGGEIMAGISYTFIYDGTTFILASGSGGGGDGSYVHPATHSMDIMIEGANTKIMSDTERTKLTGIETGATGDQTGAEIKIVYEAELDTNAYTDAEKSKLAGVEDGATAYTHPATHEISEVNGLQTALDSKASTADVGDKATLTTADKTSLVNAINEVAAGGGGSGGHTIVDSGDISMTQRSKLKFVGATVADDSGNDQTTVTITGGGGGSIIDTDTTHQVASFAELETLLLDSTLDDARASNTRLIIEWTATGDTEVDQPYDILFDNVKFIATNGGTFSVPSTFTDDYAFKFGVNCEFVATLTSLLLVTQ